MLELWGMQSTPSSPFLPDPLWPGMVPPDGALSMGLRELNCVLKQNWIAWNRTVLTFKLLTFIADISRTVTKNDCFIWVAVKCSTHHSQLDFIFVSHFKVQELRSILTPLMLALTVFFNADVNTNVHTFLDSCYFVLVFSGNIYDIYILFGCRSSKFSLLVYCI